MGPSRHLPPGARHRFLLDAMSFVDRRRPIPVSAAVLEPNALACGVVTVSSQTLAPDQLEQHRRELTGYCYRMLGSTFEAEDAVQETMVRAWRAAEGFEGRSSVRSWLYRIA